MTGPRLRRQLLLGLLAGATASAALVARAARPWRLVVPFPAGGAANAMARLLAERLGDRNEQPVQVENRPGAAGNIGMEAVVRAAPDGSTWLLATTVAAVNPALMRMNFDPQRDLLPVILLCSFPVHFYARRNLAADDLDTLLALARSTPAGLSCGSAGGITRLAAEQLRQRTRGQVVVVEYKGTAQAVTDVAAGHLDLAAALGGSAAPLLASGRVKRLGGASAAKPGGSETLAGLELTGWYGVFAPAGTPAELINTTNRDLNQLLSLPDVRKEIADADLTPEGGTAQRLAQTLRSDTERFARIAREAGLQPE